MKARFWGEQSARDEGGYLCAVYALCTHFVRTLYALSSGLKARFANESANADGQAQAAGPDWTGPGPLRRYHFTTLTANQGEGSF